MCEPEAPMDSRGASHHEKGDSGCGFCISEYRITEAFVKEIQKNYWFSALFRCRTPRGVRGLKSLSRPAVIARIASSHPARGAWIEIGEQRTRGAAGRRRTPRGVRGLKSISTSNCQKRAGRTPRGVRGLKFRRADDAPDRGSRTPRGVRGLKSFWRIAMSKC